MLKNKSSSHKSVFNHWKPRLEKTRHHPLGRRLGNSTSLLPHWPSRWIPRAGCFHIHSISSISHCALEILCSCPDQALHFTGAHPSLVANKQQGWEYLDTLQTLYGHVLHETVGYESPALQYKVKSHVSNWRCCYVARSLWGLFPSAQIIHK